MRYSVIAAKDGDVFHDTVEADNQEEAERLARELVADAWEMAELLERAIADDDALAFEAELDGFAVDPDERPTAEELERIASAVQWAGHFATQLGDCKPGGPAFSSIAEATAILERHGARICHCEATRRAINATRQLEHERHVAEAASQLTTRLPDPLRELEPAGDETRHD